MLQVQPDMCYSHNDEKWEQQGWLVKDLQDTRNRVDDMRADHLRSHGYPQDRIFTLASRGSLGNECFTSFFSSDNSQWRHFLQDLPNVLRCYRPLGGLGHALGDFIKCPLPIYKLGDAVEEFSQLDELTIPDCQPLLLSKTCLRKLTDQLYPGCQGWQFRNFYG